MADGDFQERAERLLAHLDALAAALAAGGVPDERASRLLVRASAAVLQALTLDELVAAATAEWVATPRPVPLAAPTPPAEPRPVIPLAA